MGSLDKTCNIDKSYSCRCDFANILNLCQLKKNFVRNLNHTDIFIDGCKGMRSNTSFWFCYQSIKKRRFSSVGKSYNTYFKTHITVKIIIIVIDLTNIL